MNLSTAEVIRGPLLISSRGLSSGMIFTWVFAAAFLLLLSKIVLDGGRRRGHKGPKRWPIVGSYFQIVRNFPAFHDWLLSYFGDDCRTFAVDWGTFYSIFTVDPANVEYILKTNFANYPKGDLVHEKNYELMGDGIFNSDGDIWKRHRKLASYEFSLRKVNEFSAKVFKKCAINLMEVLDSFANSQNVLDFQDLCMRMTLDSICEIAFGVQMNFLSPSLHDVPFATSFDRANELIVRRSIGPVWKVLKALNIGSEKELKKHIQVLDAFTFNLIQKRRNEIEAFAKSGNEYEKQDLLSRFMASKKNDDSEDQNGTYKDKELRDVILNFIIAGRDTTAVSLSWFVYCICRHPRVADKIRLELDQVFGQETLNFADFGELLTTETLRKLHYLQAAISETLRLFPPVPKDGKSAASDDVLPDGTKVKKGDAVTYVPYSMGRMKFLWGDDALEFIPERWIKHSEYQAESPFKYTVFQAGPRICLGKDAAYLQIKITAAMLIRYFQFDMVKDQVVNYRMLMVMAMLNGIKVKVSKL